MAGRVEYTIDELAREAGTTVRSLRVYHERGVLPPPRVKGRTGFYGAEHLNRVRSSSRLLDRGIKLNGIKELLAAWDRGDDLGAMMQPFDIGGEARIAFPFRMAEFVGQFGELAVIADRDDHMAIRGRETLVGDEGGMAVD